MTGDGCGGNELVTCGRRRRAELYGDTLPYLHGRCREILGDPRILVVFPELTPLDLPLARQIIVTDTCPLYQLSLWT